MLRKQFQTPAFNRGLSLIELMIALVAGLIVSGAALALVVSIMKSNADTIRATRLTQELRTTAEVMARDLRRARSVADPIANVGIASASMLKACNAITPVSGASASCVTFGYDCTGATAGTFHAIGLVGGKVRLTTSTSGVPACPTAGAGTQLSSDIITVTGLNISAVNDAYTIRLIGRFTNPSTTPLSRSITQEVRVRSAAVN